MVDAVVVGGIVGNILSVVGIVITNKYLTEVDGFQYVVFLSALHFAFTMFGTRVLLGMGMFSFKEAEIAAVMPVALGSLLSVAFMNLNLQYNSVGFYQLSKLACIPFTLAVQYIAYYQPVSSKVQMCLVPIIFGVGYATVHDLDMNFVGSCFAVCAVVATSMAQIFTSTYQKSLDCDALQLLYHTSPIIFAGMVILCPMFEDTSALYAFVYTPGCVFRILLSCGFALGVNISNYLVLGKLGPLTYQVVGHLKTVLILLLGFLMFNKTLDMRNIIGIIIAMTGVVAYSEIKRKETTVPAAGTLPK
jgi:solute carrier family 35 protein E3